MQRQDRHYSLDLSVLNMDHKEISLEEMKKVEIGVLMHIDSFCKEHKLQYAIGYGTLIGAVRHQGFIPWDDDIDIMMPRPDYDMFIEIYSDSLFPLLCMEHGNYYRTYAKVYDSRTIITNTKNKEMGVFVDVIPIDGLPQKEEDARLFLKKMVRKRKFLYNLIDHSIFNRRKSFLKTVYFTIVGTFIPVDRAIARFLRLSKKHDFNSTNYVAGFAVGPDKWLLKREYVDGVIDLTFEGIKVKAPQRYDLCLRALYGDYMQLPPEEERIPKHAYRAYWK